MTPRWVRGGSGTRDGILGCNAVKVDAKSGQVDAWSTLKHGDGGIGTHEPVSSKRRQFTDRYAISRDDEAFALVQSPHDLAAVVPKLPLGDFFGHHGSVAQRATSGRRRVGCHTSRYHCSPEIDEGAVDRWCAVRIIRTRVHLGSPGQGFVLRACDFLGRRVSAICTTESIRGTRTRRGCHRNQGQRPAYWRDMAMRVSLSVSLMRSPERSMVTVCNAPVNGNGAL